MRVVFMGTPEFAATVLDDLVQQHEVVAVYTRPDAVRGRGKRLEPSPVKRVAQSRGIPVFTPRSLRDEAVQRELAAFNPDVICVAAYGAILPKAVLDLPKFGCLNVHASMLPRWRGAAPVERAILCGDEEAGVCIMRMEEGLDTGAYCVCRTTPLDSKHAEDLTDELANLGSHALLTALVHVESGVADWIEQDEDQVTYASKIDKGELNLSTEDTVVQAVRKVQASSAAHPSRVMLADRPTTLLVLAATDLESVPEGALSEIAAGDLCFVAKRLFLGMADATVEVVLVKPDGKQAMDAKSFAAGIQGIKQGGLKWKGLHA